MSKTVNRPHSGPTGPRRCEPISGANLLLTNKTLETIHPFLRVRTIEGTVPPLIASRSYNGTESNVLLFNTIKNMAKTIKAARSAITGRFTTMRYAETHPRTTVVEKVKVGPIKKQK